MGKLIVKDNALIEASHKLSEVEQRLILLAIIKGREHCDSIRQLTGKELIIHADEYAKTFGISTKMSYKSLKKAVMGLFEAKWGYKYLNEKGNKVVHYERFTQSAMYIEGEGVVSFRFADAIIPMLVELERNFTTYEIEQVANLSSRYAMRLYEFFMQHLNKKTGKGWLDISLDDLRFRLGLLPTEYDTMSNFKKFVLDFGMKQINEKTDLTAQYQQKKQGRSIVGFRFEYESKTYLKQAKTEPSIDYDNLTDDEKAIVKNKNAYADSINADDTHRQNLIKKAIEQHREIQAEKEKEKAKKKTEKAKLKQQKQAENQAKEQAEKDKKQSTDERKKQLIERFESLSDDEKDTLLDTIRYQVPKYFTGIYDRMRQGNQAHTDAQFISYFFDYFGI